MCYFKEWLEDRIRAYKNVSFENADFMPSTAYELGRYDELIEIKYLLENYGSDD